jgi:predicted metalloprotease with PDZ domain
MYKSILSLLLLACQITISQTYNSYQISFKNAVHHEATIQAEFTNLENKVLELRMSRTSTGRYALHEFAKNVYAVKAVDSKGNRLPITRPNPYQWNVSGHDGTVKIEYTLFANRGGGTYSQIDETHAHLNIPATFMYARRYTQRPIQVTFNVRNDLNWKIATQLKPLRNGTYYAPNLDYFMDSPTEISNFSKRSFTVNSNNKEYTINFILHHTGTEEELGQYVEKVKKIVNQEMAVYGELPDYDYGSYTFLACYMPNVSGDGMEHRNSTVLTSTRGLLYGGMEGNIGTVSHEYFHSWNVERIRPKTLEPFNYEAVNMSGALWFAEGFTSYYTKLILCRAQIISPQKYVEGLAGTLNYVWNSPARNYFNPIEMSYQAPFVDAARSVDPVNRENTFISYYSYGSVLGLALDLSLRNLDGHKNLDGFMKLVWQTYGKTEVAYTIRDLEALLCEYAGAEFSHHFFSNYIFASNMPDYSTLFASVGIAFEQPNIDKVSIGVKLNDKFWVTSNPFQGSAAYKAGLENRDEILAINDIQVSSATNQALFLSQFKPGQTVNIVFKRFGNQKETQLTFDADISYATGLVEKVSKKVADKKRAWLGIRK